MNYKSFIQKIVVGLMLIGFIFTATGCDKVIIGTNLEKGDKYFARGDFQNAQLYYMKAAEEYQARLGKVYSNKADAKADANKMIEAYFKAGLSYEKLANDASARAMFEKTLLTTYNVKESYYEKVQIPVPAGYQDRWVPDAYKDVYVDGHYEDIYIDGGTQQV